MTRTIRVLAGLAVALTLPAGCTVKKQEAPALSGPSVLATSITLTANPDILRQDGASQSQVVVLALDANGQPVRNLPVRVDIAVGGVIADFGQVSSRNVVTGSDGRASLVYTAPNAPADPVDYGTTIQILATPTGTNYANATTRVVNIRLVPPGIILPPNGAPTARFTVSPSAPITQADVTFDASTSTDPDGTIVAYAWTFGDGNAGTGSVVRHQYQQAGTYAVTLKVTDDRGLTGSLTQDVFVVASAAPTASFTFSPSSPRPEETITFNASASRAATGRQIVSYDWEFGTGRTGTGVTTTKTYSLPGTYVVTLVVTDNIGNKGTATQSVPVRSATLVASFVFSPSAPAPGQNVHFDASGSAADTSRTIVAYDWNFGDGGTATGRTANKIYNADGTYRATLSIRDDIGQVSSTSAIVPVSSGNITADFTFSPTTPIRTDTVFFNGGDSTSPFGITSWSWEFGDGATASGREATHGYSAAAACPGGGATEVKFVVRLTVRDAMSRTATKTKEVPVKNCY